MQALKYGPGLEPSSGVGAMVSVKERDKIAALVETALAEGAQARTGGVTPSVEGAFYPPTVLTGVVHGHEITRQEVFGPVATIVEFVDDADAVAWANDTDMGLIAYVYSADLRRAIRTAERLDSGMVAINRGVASEPAAPFGGVKQSGLGREGSHEGIEEFLEMKYLAMPL